MRSHQPVLTNPTQLPLQFLLCDGREIRTIAEAAKFIDGLETSYSCLHWQVAGATLEAADRHPANKGLLKTAAGAMEVALETDGVLLAKE